MSAEGDRPLQSNRLLTRDYGLLVLYCLVVFGVALVSGRPLSVHEAVLPQSAREMLADGDWVIPKKGGTPWLESPPLPQWVTVGIAGLFGRCDEVGIVRLGAVLMGTLVVLLTAWMASVWFGRSMGLLSGFIMATTCQHVRYSWLAEDEIYLCALVTAAIALFVRLEFTSVQNREHTDRPILQTIFGGRSWWVLAFFMAMGATNLAKGLLFGTAMAGIPLAGFMLWNADWSRLKRYVWFWGWAAFFLVAAVWPVLAYARYAEVLEVWSYDLGGRMDGTYTARVEPIWYYPVNLLWMLAPWTLVIPFGLAATARAVWSQRYSPQRFLWCWAILIPAVFSLMGGKHHHYMLHALAPWSVLSAFGLLRVRDHVLSWRSLWRHPAWSVVVIALPLMAALGLSIDKLPASRAAVLTAIALCPLLAMGLSWTLLHRNTRLASTALFVMLAAGYVTGHVSAGRHFDRHRFDAAFLQEVRRQLPPGEAVLVDMDVGPLRGFLCLFYLDDNVQPLHNISFVLDEAIGGRQVYLLTQYGKQREIADVGRCKVVLQSERSGGERTPDDRLTLFRLHYHDEVERLPADSVAVSPMQAMYRTAGPVLSRR